MHSRRIAPLAAIAVASALLLPGAALGGAHSAGSHTVILKDIRFHPGTLNIRRGDTVTWQWRDGKTKHNVTFRSVHSHTMNSGSYTLRFNSRGTFEYHCSIHVKEGMKGKVVVS